MNLGATKVQHQLNLPSTSTTPREHHDFHRLLQHITHHEQVPSHKNVDQAPGGGLSAQVRAVLSGFSGQDKIPHCSLIG